MPVMILCELSPKLSWYIARSSGIVAWLLLSASVIWGLVISSRVLNKATTPGWLLDLHRFLGAVSLVLTAIHIAALVGDNYVHFGLVEILVPWASEWKSTAVAAGVVALYLLVAIEITSLLRARISRKLWRSVHYLSFPLYLLTTVHGLWAGTDADARMYEWVTVAVTTATIVMLTVRLVATRGPRARRSVVSISEAD